MATYDPPTVPPTWKPIDLRAFVPLESPPQGRTSTHLPELPSTLRGPASFIFSDAYNLSTHIVPAAYLRVTPHIGLPSQIPGSLNKADRRDFVKREVDLLLEMKIKQSLSEPLMEGKRDEKILWICVNRYVKKNLQSQRHHGLTLFFAHANGSPKEIWEPTLQYLLGNPSTPVVDEVWVWEAVNHGDSALLNCGNLSGIVDWMDFSRDILNFFINYLPPKAEQSSLPTHLAAVPNSESESRKAHGFKNRTLAVVAHSLGACTSALAVIKYPALFSSLVLIDPAIIQPHIAEGIARTFPYTKGAFQRRECWPSREEAFHELRTIPFISTWHPDVLAAYVEYALYPDPRDATRRAVCLKTPAIQEALVFAEVYVPFEVWQLIEHLGDRIEIRWICAGRLGAGAGGEEMAQARVWRRPVNSTHIRLGNAGHLVGFPISEPQSVDLTNMKVPHEAPRELAQDLSDFLSRKYGSTPAKL